jgi:PAS domain S-box-containing protein
MKGKHTFNLVLSLFYTKKYFFVFCMLVYCSAFAQKQNEADEFQLKKIDSLQSIITDSKSDTARVSAYVALSEELYLSNIDTVLPLCFKAIAIIDGGINTIDKDERRSLLFNKAKAFNNIGYVYKTQGNLAKALEWYNKSLKIRHDIGDKYGLANSYNNIGLIYNNWGNVSRAVEFFEKSSQIQNEIGDLQGFSISLSNLGQIFKNQGDVPRALEYYNKSLKIQEEIGDKQGVAISLSYIGQAFDVQTDFPKKLEYYNKSLKILEDVKDKRGISILLNCLGDLYKDQGLIFIQDSVKNGYFDKGLEYYSKSLSIENEIGNKSGIAHSLGGIGFIYTERAAIEHNPDSVNSKYNQALEWTNKCLTTWEEIGEQQGISKTLCRLGSIYLKQAKNAFGEPRKAETLLKKAEENCVRSLQIAKQLDYPELIKDASESLAAIYQALGKVAYSSGNMGGAAQNYEKAFEMRELVKVTNERINNVEFQKSVLKKQLKLEFEKKQNETSEQQKIKDALAQEEKQKQTVYLVAVLCILVLVVAFSFFVYRSYRQKERLNVELEKLSIVASETDNGIVICEPNGTLEWINPGMERLLGYTIDGWRERGNSLQEISYNPEIIDKVNHSIKSKQTVSYESLNYTKDGRKLWIHSTLTPILDKNGDVKKLVVIDTDITERKKTESIIEIKNREITDSMHAAKRIQHVLLASDTLLNKNLPEYFILYKPKDIVSGDFYWANMIDNKFVMITADCTGHGVPGAFMSLLNITFLNEAVVEKRINSPEKILDYVRTQIINSLNPEGSEFESKDGMDATLCVFDFKGMWLRFSCANNPLWVYRNNDFIRFKPDKMPVGMHHGEQKPFTAHTLGLRKGDIVYTFTDGFADQFGGVNGKKLKYKALKELLLSVQSKSMAEQKEILNAAFESWKGNLEQVDDVLISGIRV